MRTLVAILALSPALVHAQTASPAQPVSTPTLQAGLVRPAVALRTQPAAASAAAVITDARIAEAAPFYTSSDSPFATRPLRTVVIDVAVEKSGKAGEITILDSTDPLANADVITAAKQSRYVPATVGGVPVATHLRVTYNIKRAND